LRRFKATELRNQLKLNAIKARQVGQ
jgi:hypothetical protein